MLPADPAERADAPNARTFVEIDGFRCYAPAMALECADYPSEGFDVTAEVEANSFWCRSRNRLLRRVVERYTDRPRQLTMLEIGCRTARGISELRHISNLRLTASEVYVQGLQYARSRFPEVDFVQ